MLDHPTMSLDELRATPASILRQRDPNEPLSIDMLHSILTRLDFWQLRGFATQSVVINEGPVHSAGTSSGAAENPQTCQIIESHRRILDVGSLVSSDRFPTTWLPEGEASAPLGALESTALSDTSSGMPDLVPDFEFEDREGNFGPDDFRGTWEQGVRFSQWRQRPDHYRIVPCKVCYGHVSVPERILLSDDDNDVSVNLTNRCSVCMDVVCDECLIKHPRAPEGICHSHGVEYEPGENVFLLKDRVRQNEVVVYAKADGRHNQQHSPMMWDSRVKFHLRPAMCGLARPLSFVLHVSDVIKVPKHMWCKRCFGTGEFNAGGIRLHGPSWIDQQGYCDQEPDSRFVRDFAQVRRMYLNVDEDGLETQHHRDTAEQFIRIESSIRRAIILNRFGNERPRQWRWPFVSLPSDSQGYPEFEGRIFDGWRVRRNRLSMDNESQQLRNQNLYHGRLSRFQDQWVRVVENQRRFGNRYRPRPEFRPRLVHDDSARRR